LEKLKVFEAFAGYGSQSISLRDIGIDYEIVGISEIEPDAIIAYGSIRYNLDNIDIDNITISQMKEELINKNIGIDFKTGKSKIPRMSSNKTSILFDKFIIQKQ
jgi:DNA (cytosine-5)-methyltransferase 1